MSNPGGLVARRIGQVASLDTLRGMSALAVCWYHFSGNSLVGAGPIRASGAYGWLGVEVFFVISGFVIPLALLRERYSLSNYKTFLLKRIARLYPPYLASVAIGFGLLVVHSLYKGYARVDFNGDDLILHLAFLNDFFDKPWLNSIYWSLAIEMQFYLLAGLLFPLLFSSEAWRRYVAYSAVALPVVVLPGDVFLFHFGCLFLLGIVTLHYSIGVIRRFEYVTLLTLGLIGVLFVLGLPGVAAGLFAVLAILFCDKGFRLLDSVGKISYSLYLLHSSIGSLVLFLLLRFVFAGSDLKKLIALSISVLATGGIATLMYYLIERPAMKSSAGIRYSEKEKLGGDAPGLEMPLVVKDLVTVNDR